MTDSRIDKWLGWIEGPIRNDVLSMHLRRDTFETVGQIIQDADLPPSYYWEYLQDTYATTQAVAIRRQAEPNPRVRSLGQMVSEVRDDPERLGRAAFVETWGTDEDLDEHMANQTFDEHFAGEVGDHLDPAIPAADLDALHTTAEKVKDYVDQHVAHSDARPSQDMPTYADLHNAVDQIGEVFGKYALLLTAAGYGSLVPVIQHDWKAVFRQAWLPPGARRPPPSQPSQ